MKLNNTILLEIRQWDLLELAVLYAVKLLVNCFSPNSMAGKLQPTDQGHPTKLVHPASQAFNVYDAANQSKDLFLIFE